MQKSNIPAEILNWVYNSGVYDTDEIKSFDEEWKAVWEQCTFRFSKEHNTWIMTNAEGANSPFLPDSGFVTSLHNAEQWGWVPVK
jgi:hypothetical protein